MPGHVPSPAVATNSSQLPSLNNCPLPKGKIPHQRSMSLDYTGTVGGNGSKRTSKEGKGL